MQLDFATNRLNAAEAADKLLASMSAAPDATTWLLVDRATVDRTKLHSAINKLATPTYDTLSRSELTAFGDAAPMLVQLPADKHQMRGSAERIISVSPEAPAYSWLRSTAKPEHLCKVFSALAKPKVDRDLSVHCRFADSRVLPALWAALDGSQLAGIKATVTSWYCFSRTGDVLQLPPAAPPAFTPDWASPFTLSDAQFKSMLDASEADLVFKLMVDKTPEVVPSEERGDFHCQLLSLLATANTLKLHQTADRVQFVMLSLTCGEPFYTHPQLHDLWRAIEKGEERLTEAMQNWSDTLWSELQQHGGAASVKGLQWVSQSTASRA